MASPKTRTPGSSKTEAGKLEIKSRAKREKPVQALKNRDLPDG
jgi:hypothetical protein